MAVTIAGTNGLFTRLGKLFFIAEKVEAHQGTGANSLADEIEDTVDTFSSADMHMVSNFTGRDAILSHQKNAANIYNDIKGIAQRSVIEMVNDDTTLNQKTLRHALVELIDQMGCCRCCIFCSGR